MALVHTLQGVTDYVCSWSIISRTNAAIIGEPAQSGSCEITIVMTKAGSVHEIVTKDIRKDACLNVGFVKHYLVQSSPTK